MSALMTPGSAREIYEARAAAHRAQQQAQQLRDQRRAAKERIAAERVRERAARRTPAEAAAGERGTKLAQQQLEHLAYLARIRAEAAERDRIVNRALTRGSHVREQDRSRVRTR